MHILSSISNERVRHVFFYFFKKVRLNKTTWQCDFVLISFHLQYKTNCSAALKSFRVRIAPVYIREQHEIANMVLASTACNSNDVSLTARPLLSLASTLFLTFTHVSYKSTATTRFTLVSLRLKEHSSFLV